MGCAHSLPYGWAIQRDVVHLKRAMYPVSVYLVCFVTFYCILISVKGKVIPKQAM